MNKKIMILLSSLLIATLIIVSFSVFWPEDEEIIIPNPGEIHVQYDNYTSDMSYDFELIFKPDIIEITANIFNRTSDMVLHEIKGDYNCSIGNDIWFPLMKGLMEKKGNDPDLYCMCIADRSIEMIDDHGNVIVQGKFNSHKFHVDVEEEYTRAWVSGNNDIEKGYNNLNTLCSDLIKVLDYESLKIGDYYFTPENEQRLIEDDDEYYYVGGGCLGPHSLQVADFSNDSFSGDIQELMIQIKYKTDPSYSNLNSLKILYSGSIIDTGYAFNSTENEIEIRIDISERFDLQTINIEEIELMYENHGGIVSTPVIYFDYICLEVMIELT